MSEIIFAHPRHDYGSYADYKRLISLAGYPQIYVDEIDKDSNNLYIISSPDITMYQGFENARCKVIGYDLEHYTDFDPSKYPNVQFWTADKAYAQLKGIKWVFMGSDEGLAGYELEYAGYAMEHPTSEPVKTIPNYGLWHESYPVRYVQSHNKLYDVIMLSHMTWRRQVVWGDMERNGLRLAPKNEGLHGQERDTLLRQTRAMVYVHQRDEYKAVAPQRMALAAAYGLPVISETLPNPEPFIIKGKSHNVLMSTYDQLATFAAMWVNRNDDHFLKDFGLSLHQLLCHQHTFKKQIEGNV